MKRKRRCKWCGKCFFPNHRLGKRQKCCGRVDCRQKQKNKAHNLLKSKNKKAYLVGLKDWRVENPEYWKTYRENHPEYTDRNRNQTRIRKSFSVSKTGLQKRIDILQLSEKQMEFWSLVRFAKENRSLTPLLYAINRDNDPNILQRALC